MKGLIQMQYEEPYTLEQIRQHYDAETYEMLKNDPVHRWRALTGIELIHKEPSFDELQRIWRNWNLMPDELKSKSDAKSMELFGVDNETHFYQLQDEYDYFEKDSVNQSEVDNWRSTQKMFY